METLRDFVAELLESQGAAIATLEPDGLEVLAPPVVRKALGWPELARLGFGAELPDQAMRIGLEGDWLDRFGGLLHENGRWAERQMTLANPPALGDGQRLLDRAIELPNAVCRFHSVEATWTRCLILTFRYTALSDEKREGLVWLGFNLGTGAVLDEVLTRLRAVLADDGEWRLPEPEARRAAGSTWDWRSSRRGSRPCWMTGCGANCNRSCAPCTVGSIATGRGYMPITTTCGVGR